MPIKFSSLTTMPIESTNKLIGLYKDANDNYQNCNIDTSNILTYFNSIIDRIFPIGSLYFNLNDTNPIQTLGIGEWQLISTDRVLQCSGTNPAGSLIEPGLPSFEHTHKISNLLVSSAGEHTHTRGTMNITGQYGARGMRSPVTASGAFYDAGTNAAGDSGTTDSSRLIGFDASRNWTGETSSNGAHTHTLNGSTQNNTPVNAIFGKSQTVQPPAYVINVWKRIS